MTTEEQLQGWTGPSSTTEQDKQERTERMVREAISEHPAFKDCKLDVYSKGSYPNNTNVQSDSDVDIAVQCHEAQYWEEESPGDHPAGPAYSGVWTPAKLRTELVAALKEKFPNQVDTTGSVAIRVHSSSSRVDADVVPCFDYRKYFSSGSTRDGTRIFSKTGGSFENYPTQHLSKGRSKNTATNLSFKRAVRILKRVENLMVDNGVHREVPSYFIECLTFNCPDSILNRSTWIETTKGLLFHIWDDLQGDDEPSNSGERWVEVNDAKYLFHSAQKWTRKDGRDFAKAAWNYLGFAS